MRSGRGAGLDEGDEGRRLLCSVSLSVRIPGIAPVAS
jgi:hypothetical protein